MSIFAFGLFSVTAFAVWIAIQVVPVVVGTFVPVVVRTVLDSVER